MMSKFLLLPDKRTPSPYAFFRLYWRPFTILHLFLVPMLIALFRGEAGPGHPLSGFSWLSRLNLMSFVVPAVAGMMAGGARRELIHKPFSFVLPNVRRSMLPGVSLFGIATALLVAWIYTYLDGPAALVPVFAAAMLWFSVSEAMAVSSGIPRWENAWRLGVIVLAGTQIDRIVGLYTSHPLLGTGLAASGVAFCLLRTFDSGAARARALIPLSENLASLEREMTARKRPSHRIWEHSAPLARRIDWLRALAYESFGANRTGWIGTYGLAGIIFVSIFAAIATMEGFQKASQEPYLKLVFHTIFGAQPYLWKPQGALSALLVVSIFSGTGLKSLSPHNGLVYPLSRNQRAQLVYWGDLLQNAALCGAMALATLAFGITAGHLAGVSIELNSPPAFTRPLVASFALVPVVQWMRLRYGRHNPWMAAATVLYMAIVAPLIVTWLRLASDIPDAYEVAALACLLILSQGLYYLRLMTYFQRADLI